MLLRRSRLLNIAAEIVRRVAIRHQAAARADQHRQMLDADRALVFARAAGRALPEHLFRIDLTKLAIAHTREQRFLRLQDDRLRVQLLPAPQAGHSPGSARTRRR